LMCTTLHNGIAPLAGSFRHNRPALVRGHEKVALAHFP
jgi:hypothetical protein